MDALGGFGVFSMLFGSAADCILKEIKNHANSHGGSSSRAGLEPCMLDNWPKCAKSAAPATAHGSFRETIVIYKLYGVCGLK